MKKFFSIITVCYNCENDVDITLNSIMNQTCDNYELIIIDGKSGDNTLKKVKKYNKYINDMIIISEKDNGIYDAMNKGVRNASGEYIVFLNMGDQFCDNNVLLDIKEKIINSNTIYYGNYIINEKIHKYKYRLTNLYFLLELTINHQSIFAPRSSLSEHPFDTQFKLCADREWIIYNWKLKKYKFKYIDRSVVIYDSTGISSNFNKVAEESKKVLAIYYNKYLVTLVKVKTIIVKFIRKICGNN